MCFAIMVEMRDRYIIRGQNYINFCSNSCTQQHNFTSSIICTLCGYLFGMDWLHVENGVLFPQASGLRISSNFSRATKPCMQMCSNRQTYGKDIANFCKCPQAVRSAGLGRRFGGITVIAHAYSVRAESQR